MSLLILKCFQRELLKYYLRMQTPRFFCVFDMDTVVKYGLQNKHKDFVAALDSEINSGQVVLCESMPSFEFWLLLHFTDYEGLLKNYSEVSNVLAPYLKPYFNSSTVSFKKLIKRDKYLKDSAWVKLLLEEGRLEDAVERAKVCLSREINESGEHSYTKVFKAFE